MRFWVLLISALMASLTNSPAWAAAEKGPRCSDGIDNDGDTLVDGDDPDCGGEQPASRNVILVDANGIQVGVPYYNATNGTQVFAFIDGDNVPKIAYLKSDLNGELSVVGTGQIYFSDSNCSGTAYLNQPTKELLGTHYYGYYLWDPNSVRVSLTAASRFDGADNTCYNMNQSGGWNAAVRVEITHTPPLRFEIR